ncbi:MAG: hypothetical protein CO109_06070 [Deltaproteobacteria bacterium CG_4_9_14_3_um_filter_65_9]|nr:MAG: hypothetical protein CO109_06070 [Deltaproteobacteria bacterium CG_4_9_14_3_um_filter_65_9]
MNGMAGREGEPVEGRKITIARREIEERYGPIGDGKKILFVNGVPMALSTLSRRLGLQYNDLIPIDTGNLPDDTHWLRFYDNERRMVMVVEFDRSFGFTGERGADIMDWLGDDYFRIHWRAFCPAGGEEWLGADGSRTKGER